MGLKGQQQTTAGALTPWLAVVALLGLSLGVARATGGTYGSIGAVFAFAAPAAALCVLAAAVMLWLAWRDNNGELGVLGLFFFAVSEVALVYSLTLPGVLFEANTTSGFAGFLALPTAVVVGWPLLAPRSRPARALGRRWKAWTIFWLTTLLLASAVLLLAPTTAPVLDTSGWLGSAVTVASGVAIAWMSGQHLRLYRLSGLRSSLAAAVGLLVLGASSLGFLQATPLSAAFWLAHILDVAGIAVGAVTAARCYGQGVDLRTLMRPIVSLDPLVSLELAMDPTVHAFVASLDEKDPITRDHVVRVGELATRVGLRAGLPTQRLPILAVGAVLHDVGKLQIDDAILKKPGKLDPDEFDTMKTHAALGADMLAQSPALAAAAPLVRAHHERPDGGGYPAGISGDALPVEARIISACDAFDAIANTRQYRVGRGTDLALSVLREHLGTQFDAEVVDWLSAEVDANCVDAEVFHEIGRSESSTAAVPVCADCELDVSHLLADATA